jgi:DNA-binding NtrC family response regulator
MPGSEVRNDSQSGEKPACLAILIVDDEPLIRWSLREAFAARGHQVATAGTGAEALLALMAGPTRFGVVILDYCLPDRHDLSLLDDVRAASPRSIVVMMTAFADGEMRTRALGRGVHAVVDKPFQVKSFVSLVESSVAS